MGDIKNISNLADMERSPERIDLSKFFHIFVTISLSLCVKKRNTWAV